jgi:hypothetical protein
VSNTTRQTSSYDERYVVPLEASRRGAHRARVSPVMAALPVVAVVGIVVGAIVLVYVLFGKLGGAPDSSTQAAPSATPTAGATAAPSATPTAAEPTSASPTVTESVDKTVPVAVYNATGTSGLARKVGNRLVAAGWTLGPVQSWTKGSVTATTVYYGTQEQRATALAVAKSVGHAAVRLSASKAGTGIAVVVAPDYPGAGGSFGATSTRTRSTSQNAGATATKSPKATKPTDPAGDGAPSPTAGAASPTGSPQG